jgi:tellurite resistance protein TerC
MVSPLAWGLTLAAIAGLLALDLVVSSRRRAAIELGAALGWSLFYIAAALVFGVVLASLAGWDLGTQYFAGYVVEKSLSIDNLFVFVIIMATFAVPAEQQSRALTIGIVVALVLRATLIAMGAALLDAFSIMFAVFGVMLLVTAVQLLRHRHQDPSVDDNPVVAVARRALPITDRYRGGRVLTIVDGRRALTPMFLVLIAIGTTDLVFALDSIPAVFGVTSSAYVVFCANAFALLGLRALFFLVSGLLDRLVYLSIGLSMVLAFIGVKLILHYAHTASPAVPELSTGLSLTVIVLTLSVTALASLIQTRSHPDERAHSGAVRGHRRPTAAGSEPEMHAAPEPEVHAVAEPEVHAVAEPEVHAVAEPEMHAAPHSQGTPAAELSGR